jgi:hypothetical protein
VAAVAATVVLSAAGFVRMAREVPARELGPQLSAVTLQPVIGRPAGRSAEPAPPGKTAAVAENDAAGTERPASSPSPLPAPMRRAAIFVDVVHLHRLGGCHGRLQLTRDGVVFTTEENDGREGFALKHAEFVHALDGDTLTLKTAGRTFRFKAEESSEDSRTRLRDLANRIARARG